MNELQLRLVIIGLGIGLFLIFFLIYLLVADYENRLERLKIYNSNKYQLSPLDISIIEEHRDLIDSILTGDYVPDSFTNQPINGLLHRIEQGSL